MPQVKLPEKSLREVLLETLGLPKILESFVPTFEDMFTGPVGAMSLAKKGSLMRAVQEAARYKGNKAIELLRGSKRAKNGALIAGEYFPQEGRGRVFLGSHREPRSWRTTRSHEVQHHIQDVLAKEEGRFPGEAVVEAAQALEDFSPGYFNTLRNRSLGVTEITQEIISDMRMLGHREAKARGPAFYEAWRKLRDAFVEPLK